MSESEQNQCNRDITIDSDWIITTLMAVLLVACALLLVREIRDVLLGQIGTQRTIAYDFFRKIFTFIVAIYCYMAAYRFRGIHLKIAFVLIGTDLVADIMLTYFHAGTSLQHFVGVAGSISRQIAFAVFIVAILRWFKSVLRWAPKPEAKQGTP